jgi:DNA-binding MarR family transcriptional regulator
MGPNTSARSDTRTVLEAVRRIVQALRESSRSAERTVGLSGAQLFVLQTLAESPSISLNRLAALTHTHQSSVSTVVARLVSAGLVRRARSRTDRRTLELSLTAAGSRVAERAPDAAQGRLIAAVDMLPAVRRRQLASTLSELASMMDGAEGAPAMFFEEKGVRPNRRNRIS